MQAVLRSEDDLPDLETATEENTENTNPVILHLADQVDKLAQQVVLLQQQRQQPWVPTNQPPMNFNNGWQYAPYAPYGQPAGQGITYSPPMMQQGPPRTPKWKFLGRYCWSCGACDHWGNKCQFKKPGHINKATFKDKKGGSTENCRST